jgi:hypothetical protein
MPASIALMARPAPAPLRDRFHAGARNRDMRVASPSWPWPGHGWRAAPVPAARPGIPTGSALAQGLLGEAVMRTREHRIHGTWPLYLVIALAGAASIATSLPPIWESAFRFEGPTVTLDPDRREESIPLTIRFAPELDRTDIEVSGSVEYVDAAEELRLSLVEPGQRTLATQFQTVEGDGRLYFHFEAPGVSLRCESMESDTCKQELAVVFGTGGARTGAYVIRWHLAVKSEDADSAPEDDLYFDVALGDGRLVDYIPPPEIDVAVQPDQAGDDRWRLVSDYRVKLDVAPGQAGQTVHVVMVGEGPYTASELRAGLALHYSHDAPQESATFRITITPDEPAAGVAVEHVATVSGSGSLSLYLSIPEPLDCVDENACERGFTIELTGEKIEYGAFLHLALYGVIDGDGDDVPANASIEIVPGNAAGVAAGSSRRQDG